MASLGSNLLVGQLDGQMVAYRDVLLIAGDVAATATRSSEDPSEDTPHLLSHAASDLWKSKEGVLSPCKMTIRLYRS